MEKLVAIRVPAAKDIPESYWNCTTGLKYITLFFLAVALLVAASGLMFYWAYIIYHGDYYGADRIRLHSVLMTIGSISVNGFSIITYRICRCLFRWNIKLAHAILETAALVVIGFGVYEAYMYHDHYGFDHLNSPHGLTAAVTLILYIAQFLMGMFAFICLLICDNATATARAELIPYHATFGLITFLFSVITWLIGVSEITFSLNNLGPMSIGDAVTCTCCWVVILFVVICMYMLTTEGLRYTSHIPQNTGE